MSCYIVDDEHINVMAWALRAFGDPGHTIWDGANWLPCATDTDLDLIARTLHAWNVAAWNQRYVDVATPTYAGYLEPIHTTWTPVEIIKACDGYDYQACDAPGWENSPARHISQAIRAIAIKALPGYEQAAWEITPRDTPISER